MTETPRPVVIDNIDEALEKIARMSHTCTSQDVLTEIRITVAETSRDVTNMAAAFQELSARFEEHMNHQDQELKDTRSVLHEHTTSILELRHTCIETDKISTICSRIDVLEQDYHSRNGQGLWVDRLWNIIQSLFIVIATALIMYLLSGGKLVV